MTEPLSNRSRWRIVHSEASIGWGGQEHRVLAELAGFQARGSQVWLLAPAASEVFRRAQTAQIGTEPLDDVRWKFPLSAIKIAAWLRHIRPHVVNTHSSRDGWLVGVAARLARIPLLIRSRHVDVDYANPRLSRHAFTTLADHVLTTSDKITAHFQTLFQLTKDRVSTVPTGIDLQRYSPTGPKAELPVPVHARGLPLVGMVSVLRSWKGHASFLDAAVQLSQSGVKAHYVIVGGGAPLEAMQKIVNEHHAEAITTVAGHREDVPEVLRALSVLVIPSTRHEGVPQIGLQGLACKTSVVGSDVGGIPEIIRPNATGRIFPANDAAALAGRIREALEQTDESRRLSENGRALVEAEHSFDAMLNKVDTIYRRYLPTTAGT